MAAVTKLNRSFYCLVGFVVLCLAATVLCVILMQYMAPRNCDDHDVLRNEEIIELHGASGSKLRISLNTKRTSKRYGRYYYCSKSDKHLKKTDSLASCKTYEWRVPQFVSTVTDCFDLGPDSWFGGSILWHQKWPINGLQQEEAPYIPGDIYEDQYGGVMERFWISSGGFAIVVEDSVPLLVEMKRDRLCLTGSSQRGLPYNLSARAAGSPLLAYSVCRAADITTLYRGLKLWELPTLLPARELFAKPIWSTWAFLKQNITSESVLAFAQNISDAGLSCSQIEIDDKWSTNYGDHEFDTSRFPDPSRLVQQIHDLGYNVTVWVHPFVNSDAAAFQQGVQQMQAGQSYLVASAENSSLPAFTGWWRGTNSTLIDVTNPSGEGVKAFNAKLQRLKDIGVDSFKFDGGETNWIPQNATFAESQVNPGWYTNYWSHVAYKADERLRRQETRVGFRAQSLPMLVRTMDKDSHWGLDNGLKAVVTSALTHCLIGYNFFLPDMIGGNGYCNDTGLEGHCYDNKELYIRWLQVAVFMPSLQFSVPPWIFGPDAVEVTRRLLAVRSEERFAQNLDNALSEAKDGVPIVRPLWWILNSHFEISDQFLLGDRILVAPVLDSNQTSRDVYFPPGTWRPWFAQNGSSDIEGPGKQSNFSVPLHEVAAFYLTQP